MSIFSMRQRKPECPLTTTSTFESILSSQETDLMQCCHLERNKVLSPSFFFTIASIFNLHSLMLYANNRSQKLILKLFLYFRVLSSQMGLFLWKALSSPVFATTFHATLVSP